MPEFTSEDGRTRLHAVIRGRVQGVFFRDYAREHARRLGLEGWVRNRTDGKSVELVAEGSLVTLQELVRRLHEGPPGAHVEAVKEDWELPRSEFSSFRIL